VSAQARELSKVIDEEITRLPNRLRLPVVLCYLEGKSNSEAAAEVGCPRGTIDSRLNAARARLKGRLIRRGVAPATAAAILERLTAGDAVGAALPTTVAHSAARLAIAFTSGSAADGVISPAVAVLTHEVLHMMLISKLKWAALMVLAVGILGTGGISTYRALAGGAPQADAAPVARPDTKLDAAAVAKAVPQTNARELRKLLKSPAGLEQPIENATLRDALDLLSKKFDVPIRIDPGSFIRRGIVDRDMDPFKIYDAQVRLPVVRGMTLAEVLSDLLAQVRGDSLQARVT
jgi:RNA polymerase sigma-70 factor (ECF subfamily)